MECRNCPYIKEEFDLRMKYYDEEDDVESFCWCEKTGGKLWWYGQCGDANLNVPKQKCRSNRKRRSKRERDFKYKNRLKYLTENCQWYPSPAVYVDEIWVEGCGYVKPPKPYYKRLYRGSRSKYLKKQSNKKIRRYKGELRNGYHCHRLYDFWWKLC